MITWFRSRTSLWHMLRQTPSHIPGTWGECLERIDKDIHDCEVAPDPIYTIMNGRGRLWHRWPNQVCSRCRYFYEDVLNAPPHDDEVREKLGEDYL